MQILQESAAPPKEIIEEREIPSDRALVAPLVVRLVERLLDDGLIEKSRLKKVELCLDEAITNAVIHGNKSMFEKKVKVTLFRDSKSWGITVQDQGEGFSVDALPEADREETVWQEHGRGIAIISLYMDEVVYYDGGSTLCLRQFVKGSE